MGAGRPPAAALASRWVAAITRPHRGAGVPRGVVDAWRDTGTDARAQLTALYLLSRTGGELKRPGQMLDALDLAERGPAHDRFPLFAAWWAADFAPYREAEAILVRETDGAALVQLAVHGAHDRRILVAPVAAGRRLAVTSITGEDASQWANRLRWQRTEYLAENPAYAAARAKMRSRGV